MLFAGDQTRLARFFGAMTDLVVHSGDASHTVLASASFELVLHALHGEPAATSPLPPREDACTKLFFPMASLTEARATVAMLGGALQPAEREWSARGFRACDGVDPEGNVIQFRRAAP